MTGALDTILRPWTATILLELASGPKRYNRLLEIPGIYDKVLTPRLRDLEDAGLVSRQVIVVRPVRITYGLTVAGRRLVAPLQLLCDIGRESEEVRATA